MRASTLISPSDPSAPQEPWSCSCTRKCLTGRAIWTRVRGLPEACGCMVHEPDFSECSPMWFVVAPDIKEATLSRWPTELLQAYWAALMTKPVQGRPPVKQREMVRKILLQRQEAAAKETATCSICSARPALSGFKVCRPCTLEVSTVHPAPAQLSSGPCLNACMVAADCNRKQNASAAAAHGRGRGQASGQQPGAPQGQRQ